MIVQFSILNDNEYYYYYYYYLLILPQPAVDDLSELESQKLITSDERQWLQASTIGTRPLVVVSWIDEFFRSLETAG